MFDYKIAIIICFTIPFIPVVFFYIFRPTIREQVIKKIVKDKTLTFPLVIVGFIFLEFIAVGLAIIGFFSVFADNFDLGIVKKTLITIESFPSYGSLLINGHYWGRTPLAVPIKRLGKYKVRIESVSGYLSAETIIVVNKEGPTGYEIKLKRAPIGKITFKGKGPFLMREKPSESSSLIATLSPSEAMEVDLLTRKNDWVEVRCHDGKEGWVKFPKNLEKRFPNNLEKKVVAPEPKPPSSKLIQYVTTIVYARIRTEPSLTGKVIAEVLPNTELAVIAYKEGWYKILLPDGREGWIYSTFVKGRTE